MARETFYSSVMGTSHETTSKECQDYSLHAQVPSKYGSAADICLIADGAGSCRFSKYGAEWLCKQIKENIKSFLQKRSLEEFSTEELLKYIQAFLTALEQDIRNGEIRRSIPEADEQTTIKDFSCTLLVALLGNNYAAYFQIGDGGIVRKQSNGFWELVFKGEKGEYANQTFFVTSDKLEQHLRSDVSHAPLSDVIMFTDGIENIVVNSVSGEVSDVFFNKITGKVYHAEDGELYLNQLLNSQIINSRTDDDKTILVSIIPPLPPYLHSEPGKFFPIHCGSKIESTRAATDTSDEEPHAYVPPICVY